LAPLALADTDQPALRSNVRDLSRRPFPEAQPTRRDPLQTHAGCRAWYQGQPGAHCLRTPHDGQVLAVPGTDELEDRPRALQRALGEEPDPVAMEAARALGDLLLMAPVEDVWPELLCAHVIGSPSIVLSHVFDGCARAWLGPGGQAPAL
jgi:hypothetical protein